MTTSALKRRSFLQGSLLAAAVIGSAPVAAAEAAKPKFDESFDVIVVRTDAPEIEQRTTI